PLPPPEPPLRRPLALTRLIGALLDRAPDLAPRAAIFDLADSLAALLDEMEDEDIPPDRLAALDVAEHAAHWRRMQAFLAIAAPLAAGGRLGAAVAALADRWAVRPPQGPVVLAGSTGSRGSTLRLMGAVLALPQGAVVLPGHDGDTPAEVWDAMDDALTAEDHPQYRTRRLMQAMGLTPADLRPWTATPPAAPARNRVVSLALRPAPVTDRWLAEGRDLPDLPAAMAEVTLIEAPDPRAEAQAIALILRQAAETGTPATLITPDRTLARRVTAALDRWGLRPDDSAGRPLALSAPGRFLRHVAALAGQRLTAEALLVLLKHPLTATGADRGDHLRLTRDLELHLRRHGPMFPEPADLARWAHDRGGEAPLAWAQWIGATLAPLAEAADLPLADHVARHRTAAEALATGPGGTGPAELWSREAGLAARAAVDDLAAEAHHAASLGPQDYADLFAAVLSRRVVRETVETHPHLRILGPREARETLTGLTVLGGLTDGVWPALP
ncbi:MAG: double-strand break repair protein AddB, partial [Rhodobacterales bacterium]|nr:double-strand break repair protein AddB [Rhodobacterales bacterium]